MSFSSSGPAKSGHPDYFHNLGRANNFIKSQEGKLPNGVKVSIRDGEHIQSALISFSYSSGSSPTYASNISLHQSSEIVSEAVKSVFKGIVEIAEKYNA